MSQNLNKKVIKNFFDETPITKSHLIMIVILAMRNTKLLFVEQL